MFVMLKIAEMEYSGANSIFLRIFFDKKYALPYRVVDAVVFHFLQFRNETRELPVLWHQAFLTFVQDTRVTSALNKKKPYLIYVRFNLITKSHLKFEESWSMLNV